MTDPDAWPQRAADALGLAALTDDEIEVVLDLARDVAHGTERRFAPLTTFLAGLAVGRSETDTLEEVAATIAGLLAD
ncbi:MAG: DUF6457 domain-containing protein [Nitriliruptorales bacterium]|nr:DUF6457 domain-containing protein [Nitriliruptorales bacterium]